ncbi:MAG: hypothetical protein KF819_33025 [Labilithrix sp.]|nr:hypothetical protein [Labilithrix sp.]
MHLRRTLAATLASFLFLTTRARADGATYAQAPPPSQPVAEGPLPQAPVPPPAPVEEPPHQAPHDGSSQSVRMTYESTRVDRPGASAAAASPDDSTFLHGFRIGYGFTANYDQPVPAFDGKSLKEKVGMRTPNHFLLGYEVIYRVVGRSWLNVLIFGNFMVAGLEQSKFLPSGNLLIGFELDNSFQIGVGANLSPLKGSEGHTIVAAGWTPKVGKIYTPVHAYFIPDVDGVHRAGITTGVTF